MSIDRSIFIATVLAAAATMAAVPSLSAQGRADFQWEKSLPAGSRVSVHDVNGNITVSPSSSGRVEITGTKHGSRGDVDDLTAVVEETSDGIVVCVVWKDSGDSCNDRGYHSHGHDNWNDASMDLDVHVPTNLEVAASSVSGDVRIEGAQGRVRASSVSGDIRLSRLRASSVSANSVSGNVEASIDALTGSGDLTFKTVSGDVTLELPRDVDADLSMSSVSGELNSDFQMTLNGRMDRRHLEARIGRGGRNLDVSTVSGDVRLKAAK